MLNARHSHRHPFPGVGGCGGRSSRTPDRRSNTLTTLFTFTPDDGPPQDIEAFDVSPEVLQQAVSDHLPNGALYVTSRPLGASIEPRELLYRASLISNVRVAS